MSTKLLCMVCKTTQSQIWMGSDLVLPASKFTVLERLEGLRPQLQAFSILCTMCFSLVEHWDEQIAAATKTEQVLRGLISSPHQHLNHNGECDDGSLVREQEKGDGGHSASLGGTFSVGEVKSPQSAGHSSYEEIGVTEHPVTGSSRSNGEPPPRLSAGSNAAASDLPKAAASDANPTGQDGLEVGETVTRSEAVLGDDTAALEVGALGLTLEEPAAQSDVPCEDDPDPPPPSEAERSRDVSGAGSGDVTSDRPAPRSRSAAVAPAGSRLPAAPGAAVGGRHRCPICGKSFARSGSLSDHLAAHAGTKAYACGECGERFQYRDGLLVHRRRHHGRGRLACPHCHVHFEKSCNLSRHLRVHTGERPYACAFCPKRFAQSNGLKKHVRSLHADQ